MVTGMKVAASASTRACGSSRCHRSGAFASGGVGGWDAWDSPWASSRRLRRAALSRPSAGWRGPGGGSGHGPVSLGRPRPPRRHTVVPTVPGWSHTRVTGSPRRPGHWGPRANPGTGSTRRDRAGHDAPGPDGPRAGSQLREQLGLLRAELGVRHQPRPVQLPEVVDPLRDVRRIAPPGGHQGRGLGRRTRAGSGVRSPGRRRRTAATRAPARTPARTARPPGPGRRPATPRARRPPDRRSPPRRRPGRACRPGCRRRGGRPGRPCGVSAADSRRAPRGSAIRFRPVPPPGRSGSPAFHLAPAGPGPRPPGGDPISSSKPARPSYALKDIGASGAATRKRSAGSSDAGSSTVRSSSA
ncbi:hypothetical protein SCALM49S_05052 [Streptomyces californicus]